MNSININLLIILAIAAISFLQWAARKAKEQQIRNERKRMEQRMQDEMLRTGRAPAESGPAAPSPHDQQQARLRELAEMRRRQLEELRRQQREAAARKRGAVVRSPGTPGAPTSRLPGGRLPTAGPMSPGPVVRPAPGRPAGSRVPPPKRPGVNGRPVSESKPKGVSQSAPKPPAKATGDELYKSSLNIGGAPRPPAASYQRPPAVTESLAGTDWRHAVILAEVLGSPLGLRPPESPANRGW